MPRENSKKQWQAIKKVDQQDMVCCTLELAKRYLADYPRHGSVWLCYAKSLYAVARYKEAIAALRQALRYCPPDKVHFVQDHFGHLYKQKGQFRRAEAWFRRAIASCPSDATSYIYLGGLLAQEGRLSEAEALH